MFYQPEQDSKFLLNEIIDFLDSEFFPTSDIENNSKNKIQLNNILEVGVGSGFILSNIANLIENRIKPEDKTDKQDKKNTIKNIKYFGTDINDFAIKNTKNELKKILKTNKNFHIEKTSLFPKNLENQKRDVKYDLIFFNPPYLPLEENDDFEKLEIIDKALYGGIRGNEITLDFLQQLNSHLEEEGICFLLICDLSKPEEVYDFLKNNLFDFKITNTINFFFESLICLKITKSDVLKNLNKIQNANKIDNLKYLTKGKHSIILSGLYKEKEIKEIILKTGLENYITKEIFFLKKLQKETFVPKIYFYGENFIAMEKINGQTIFEFLKNDKIKREELIYVLDEILKITQKLDALKINKFEFVNPYKHIFIVKSKNNKIIKIKLIDFERSIFSDNPKNTRQFLQYLASKNIIEILKNKEIIIDKEKVIILGKKIKENQENNQSKTLNIALKDIVV